MMGSILQLALFRDFERKWTFFLSDISNVTLYKFTTEDTEKERV